MVSIHPHDQHLLAMVWGGNIFVDRCLPFGLRSAPKIFTAVADALAWVLYSRDQIFMPRWAEPQRPYGSRRVCVCVYVCVCMCVTLFRRFLDER